MAFRRASRTDVSGHEAEATAAHGVERNAEDEMGSKSGTARPR
jgi:hypothetical protein